MSQDRWNDLYDRLTSRKLLLALLSIGFALWGYHNGSLTGEQFQQAVMVAVTAYTAAEGASDALAAWHSKPSAPDQVVNVDTAPTADRTFVTPEQLDDVVDRLRPDVTRAIIRQMQATPPAPMDRPAYTDQGRG